MKECLLECQKEWGESREGVLFTALEDRGIVDAPKSRTFVNNATQLSSSHKATDPLSTQNYLDEGK